MLNASCFLYRSQSKSLILKCKKKHHKHHELMNWCSLILVPTKLQIYESFKATTPTFRCITVQLNVFHKMSLNIKYHNYDLYHIDYTQFHTRVLVGDDFFPFKFGSLWDRLSLTKRSCSLATVPPTKLIMSSNFINVNLKNIRLKSPRSWC